MELKRERPITDTLGGEICKPFEFESEKKDSCRIARGRGSEDRMESRQTKKKPGKRKNRWSMLVVSVQHPQSKGKGKLTSKQAVWDTGKQFDQQSTTCNMKMKGDYYTKMQVMG